jgi:hypothetical protein
VTGSGSLARFDAERGATLSPCRRYRYRLWRAWGDRASRCVFVGLNPSTADESSDDPTIRKCIGFATRWGFGAVDVVNLFAWRSTKPDGLLGAAPAHVGDDNDRALAATFRSAQRVVWAWGAHDERVRRLVQARLETDDWRRATRGVIGGTLGATKNGSPRHPLMTAYAIPFRALDTSSR